MTREETWVMVQRAVAVGDVEDTLNAIAEWLVADAVDERNPHVRACLDSAAHHCRSAAMDYYVSTK